ncbi:coproporphyrinogen III oxidase family protein [Chlamydia muridarum str. Nigg]|uniref:Heme chaperone HemW n=2 Tax=Chlamydia muridarum TaxID=83560 RepID=A0A069ZWQ2_CHLMR|nr:radical SAM family heme chaperone HemW [Chlamydia muridarum]UFW32866.1 radical SAM family heme chaperone HemW [Chlamydia trachomatis]AAF73546.1 oxygen-independent coproporphyrinogen III oxidase HemN, putative [Chlamydia muridarum str. Nigg]AHH22712.1 coproporphyrinogen III oxidase [Chlamydia muridarum str. Nigg3 CMUT3-5]AHH23636.1 coproporphyrinogen III oxidase [Chlamydia muridarum str. Nigg CM972]AID37854.1 coproporphyrinogen III oxidase [Chlamydia muridarum str. Nigg 2 MCR]
MNGKTPLALYIHVPFCSKKCHYCSFYTIPYKEELVRSYCEAVIKEGLRKLAPLRCHYYIDTVFFGGGTPSLVPPSLIQDILTTLEAHSATEVTLEANPENLSQEYIRDLSQTAVNRISIGIQTFNDPLLKLLGRTHSSSKAIETFLLCSQYGFSNLSADLIYGLPTQSISDFITDLHQAITLPIQHISVYNLTVDPHTSFYKHRKSILPSIADEDSLAEMALKAEELLENHGFNRYELASYAKNHAESKHNTYYWTDKPFLGLGVSASQYLNGIRSKNFSRISHYLRAAHHHQPTAESMEELPPCERIKEALALRLRLCDPIPFCMFPEELVNEILMNPSIRPLFAINAQTFSLNKQGRLFHDSIAEEIMCSSFSF